MWLEVMNRNRTVFPSARSSAYNYKPLLNSSVSNHVYAQSKNTVQPLQAFAKYAATASN